MRARVGAMWLSVVVLACASRAPSTRADARHVVELNAGPALPPAQSAPASRPRAPLPTKPGFGIVAFDCAATDESKSGETLRSWNLGGPNGASWNWAGDLSCPVQLRSDCDGTSMTTVFAGNAHVSRFDAVRAGVVTEIALTVPEAAWMSAQKESDPNQPYSTVHFEARVDLRCERSDGGLVDMRYWSDSFDGGFAGGE